MSTETDEEEQNSQNESNTKNDDNNNDSENNNTSLDMNNIDPERLAMAQQKFSDKDRKSTRIPTPKANEIQLTSTTTTTKLQVPKNNDINKNRESKESELDNIQSSTTQTSTNEIWYTIKKSTKQASTIDPRESHPWDDTFYHKNFKSFRKTAFDKLILDAPSTVKSASSGNELDSIFMNPNGIQKDPTASNMSLKNEDAELEEEENTMKKKNKEAQQTKFGWFFGVFCRCLLNIFGVIMFLRVGWITGQAGILLTLAIMAISCVVVVLTTLSMSALCTNGEVKGGGAYYIISRSLGPAIGGSVGILFSFGNMISVSMYLIGFAETLTEDLSIMANFRLTSDPINDVRIWSNIALLFCLILALIGLKIVVKANLFLLIFIVIALVLFFIGSFYKEKWIPDPNDKNNVIQVLFAVKGWTNGNLKNNLGPQFTTDETGQKATFWKALGIYFPAVTGIMAGANISGELLNPSVDIPKGTLYAIFFSTIIYMMMCLFVGVVTLRYELVTNYLVMADICVNKWFITIGVYAATLSSAIASLVGAPRILMAIAVDKIVPGLDCWGVSSKSGEPIRGYLLSFIVAGLCNCIGQLNAVAPLITQFFMIAYLLLNFACLGMEMAKSPGWRPSFAYFNKYTAGFGSILCLIMMFLLNYIYALIAVVVAGILYFYIEWKGNKVNWGGAQESRQFYTIYKGLLKLAKIQKHVKNWRPIFLILTEDPKLKPQLVLFAQTLKKSYGPLFFVKIDTTSDYRRNIKKYRTKNNNGYIPNLGVSKKIKGFYDCYFAKTFRDGVSSVLQCTGVGTMRPNILMLGFMRKWELSNDNHLLEYVQILRDALIMRYGVMICCNFEKINWNVLHYVPPAMEIDTYYSRKKSESAANSEAKLLTNENNKYFEDSDDDEKFIQIQKDELLEKQMSDNDNIDNNIDMTTDWSLGQGLQQFIDVYWLVQDGGYPILLPHILTKDTFWKNCMVRINVLVHENEIDTEGLDSYNNAEKLIQQMRFKYPKPRKIPIENKEIDDITLDKFEELSKLKISDIPNFDIIKRWLKLCETLYKFSRFSALNIITLPIPEKQLNPRAYMALLQMLCDSTKLPPTIFTRGNGEKSLTFSND